MRKTDQRAWAAVKDDDLVRRLIWEMQKGVATALTGTFTPDEIGYLPITEGATALLNLLASVLEPLPECGTPQGRRKVSQAVSKELALLISGVRAAKAVQVSDAQH